jgi:DNA helicase-2/ATP-dependent DNA helicase PcrA
LRVKHSGMRLYYNRLAKLLSYRGLLSEISNRVQKYFDVVCIDEVQDIGGHDFDLMLAICRGEVECLMVGDYFQHTYVSSQDGQANKNLHVDYAKYKKRFEKEGIRVDTISLLRSRRCSATVCEFISTYMGINIESHSGLISDVKYIDDQATADALYACNNTIKLFYQEHYLYGCNSQNWGGSKGQDHYQDACVVLNDTTHKIYKTGSLLELSSSTKNKLYVACSRARGNLYLVPQKLFKKYRSPV